MKYSVKNGLKVLYYFLKIHGFTPFYFDFDKQRAYSATTPLRYSILLVLIFWSFFTYYIYDICRLISRTEQDFLMMSVLIIDMATGFFKTLPVYILQLVKRRKIVESINSLMRLCEQIFGQDFNFSSFFLDSKLRNSFKKKFLSVSVQIIALTIAFITTDYNVSLYHAIQNAIFILWVNIMTTIVNSVFYCGSMLFVARFYQIFDERIRTLSQSTDGLSNVNSLGTIEQISFLYEKITQFTSKISDIYAFHIIFYLIGIIVWATTALFYLYIKLMNMKEQPSVAAVINSIVSFTFFVVEIYSICSITDSVEKSAIRMAISLHSNVALCGESTIERKIATLSLRILHHQPHCRACGLFTIDKKILFATFSSIVAYLLILVQFQFECRYCKNNE